MQRTKAALAEEANLKNVEKVVETLFLSG